MEPLHMGIDNNETDSIVIQPKKIQAHTVITGQTNCGKSTLVTRFIEEILLRDSGKVLLFDYNYEFSNFKNVVDEASFAKPYNRETCNEDEYVKFKERWDKINANKGIEYIKPDEIFIRYKDIFKDMKPIIYGIDPHGDAGAYWLIQLLEEEPKMAQWIESKDSLINFLKHLDRWYEGRMTLEEKESGGVIHHIKHHVSRLDLTRFTNGVKNLIQKEYIKFGKDTLNGCLNESYLKELYDGKMFLGIDMLHYSYTDYHVRDFIAAYILRCIWKIAQDRFSQVKKKGKKVEDALFIVIDEAHNIIPDSEDTTSRSTTETINLIKTVAAEGRKFGLFLVLISQRPNKINKNVLSECDNFIIMRSSHSTHKEIKKHLPVSEENYDDFKKKCDFKDGTAIYCGKFMGDKEKIKIVKGTIKRTQTT